MLPVILVLDVGKTHSKISLFSLSDGQLQTSFQTASQGYLTTCYKAIDTDYLWHWFFEQTTRLVKDFDIREIITTTHGATAALVDERELVFPIIDYEFDQYQQIDAEYLRQRADFSDTASPNLAAGLNLGRQLFWLQQQFPTDWKKVKSILTFPQYLSWKLCGEKVSEITSLGCHTDLWDYKRSEFSSLVQHNNWHSLFPNLCKAGLPLGAISESTSAQSGLSSDTAVLNGIHDSNASLVTYLGNTDVPKNIISSGTWIVICSLGGDIRSDPIPPEMMISMNYKNEAVPSIRFMGGREWQKLQTKSIEYDLSVLEQVIALNCFPLPAFVDAGPFAGHNGEITDEHLLSEKQRAAIGCLYIVLMSTYCLRKLQNPGDIIVEGSLTRNKIYLQLLQSLNKDQNVLVSQGETGTAYGAARLSQHAINWPEVTLEKQRFRQINGFERYYQGWLMQL